MQAAEDLGLLWGAVLLLKNFLLCLAAAAYVINTKGMKRVWGIILAIGFLALAFAIDDNYYTATMLLTLWILLIGGEFLASKEIVAALLIICWLLGYSSPFFYVLVYVLNILLLVKFLSNALGKNQNSANAEKSKNSKEKKSK